MALVKAVDPRVTFRELAEWPDDGRRYELYDGEVIVVPAPYPRHQVVSGRLVEVLVEYRRAVGGLLLDSPIDIVFSEHNVLQPDIVYFREERRHAIDMMAAIRIPPDLVIEVLSRSTEARDRGRKTQTFARFGVPEYWIVDPVRNSLEVHRLDDGRYTLHAMCGENEQVTSPTLPGLAFSTARIFEE
jgi:Uma2 family endonuclease